MSYLFASLPTDSESNPCEQANHRPEFFEVVNKVERCLLMSFGHGFCVVMLLAHDFLFLCPPCSLLRSAPALSFSFCGSSSFFSLAGDLSASMVISSDRRKKRVSSLNSKYARKHRKASNSAPRSAPQARRTRGSIAFGNSAT